MAEKEPVSVSSNNLRRAELKNTKHFTDGSSNVITTIEEKRHQCLIAEWAPRSAVEKYHSTEEELIKTVDYLLRRDHVFRAFLPIFFFFFLRIPFVSSSVWIGWKGRILTLPLTFTLSVFRSNLFSIQPSDGESYYGTRGEKKQQHMTALICTIWASAATLRNSLQISLQEKLTSLHPSTLQWL